MSKNKIEKVVFMREEYAEGEGTFKYPDGGKYEGQWKNGKKWNGTLYDEDGNIKKKIVNGEEEL